MTGGERLAGIIDVVRGELGIRTRIRTDVSTKKRNSETSLFLLS